MTSHPLTATTTLLHPEVLQAAGVLHREDFLREVLPWILTSELRGLMVHHEVNIEETSEAAER